MNIFTFELGILRFHIPFSRLHFCKISLLLVTKWVNGSGTEACSFHMLSPQICWISTPNPHTEGAHTWFFSAAFTMLGLWHMPLCCAEIYSTSLSFSVILSLDASFPSFFWFSLFIGKAFWLFSILWLLVDKLIGSAGKFENHCLHASVTSQKLPILD